MEFTENTTYTGRFFSVPDGEFEVLVIKRTPSRVTYIHPQTGEQRQAKIYQHSNEEYFFPLGRYSMAPVIRATKPEVVA